MESIDNKERFLEIFRREVTRPGAEEFLGWLCGTDFFTAPASTKYHCACPGGLVMHSLGVYDVMMEKHFAPGEDSRESFALCGLLHDLCKIGCYRAGTRNVKDDATGKWEKVPSYTFDDPLPYGHGEKSVYITNGFIRLTREEAMAIRWHMGFSGPEDNRTVGQALRMYPLAFALATADMEASYFLEDEEGS